MTREQAIRLLERTSIMVLECCTASEYEEALGMAIEALQKQEKIKEAFTHYAFNGYEMDVLKDCVHCLAEIKDILNGSGE